MRRYDRQYVWELVKYGAAFALFLIGMAVLLIVYGPSYE